MQCINDIKSGLLLVCENGISPHKWSVVRLRPAEGTLPLEVATLALKTAATGH